MYGLLYHGFGYNGPTMNDVTQRTPAVKKTGVIPRLYQWVLSWADTPYGAPALFVIALVESSFFPIPPDPLLLALGLAKPKRAVVYGVICTAGSVIGGAVGYAIGLFLIDSVGMAIIDLYGLAGKYATIRVWYEEYNAMVVLLAGVTPIPYKVFTIAAGAFKVDFLTFMLASVAGRGLRFMLEAGLVYYFGASIRAFLDRYITPLSWGFGFLIVIGFVALKFLF
jgi:membrane protein YqaA with SNARE-associated domain